MKKFRIISMVLVIIMLTGLVFVQSINTVQAAYGESIKRIESMNFAGFFIRHMSDRGRTDSVVNPIQDSQFRIVTGLANPSAVSIESVNFPGRFLRHRNGEIWLDSNDGSAIFKADATWYIRPGLADATGSSFESYNFPRRYIRHRNSILYSETVSTDIARKDATWYIKDPSAAYVMGYFAESRNEMGNNFGLHLAYSYDALNWIPLNQNNPVLSAPTVGGADGIRDPFILRKQDGTFVVVATKRNKDWIYTDPSIVVFDSPDLINFYNQRTIKVGNLNPQHAWAPEAFWDPARQMYGIVWSGNYSGQQVPNHLYVSYTTDFINVLAPEVFFDPGYSVLDGDMHKFGDTNYFYFKNENQGPIQMIVRGARSNSLNPGSFTPYTGDIYHPVKHLEGPNVIKKINENKWIMYGDTYEPNGVLYAFQSNDIASGQWSEMDRKDYTPPQNAKHTTITEVTQTELNNLINRWGNPTWNRLKCYNFAFNWVRHQNYNVVTTEEPFDPYMDSHWKIVPGLADPNGVSFEARTMPGYYMRHSNSVITTARNDGSDTFKADATFYIVPGLANGSWSSFRSYNFPDRYIRHLNSQLRIDPITTDLARQDATFKITN